MHGIVGMGLDDVMMNVVVVVMVVVKGGKTWLGRRVVGMLEV